MIVCAAIKINFIDLSDEIQEMIICGHRHQNCLYTIAHLSKKWTNWKIQGFINHKGEFLDRKEALAHALECGQLSATHRYYQEDHNIDELYSEDLY